MSFINIETNDLVVRSTQDGDLAAIQEVCKKVYPFSKPWQIDQLKNHLKLFPEGQLVAVYKEKLVGMSASLIVNWDDYENNDNWRDFTDKGYFTNHDPVEGKTLYGAEIMVDPDFQGKGIGKLIYEARRQIVLKLSLLRIRAGARLRGYSTYKDQSPYEYVYNVIEGKIFDPTLSFQLKQNFMVIALVSDYLMSDPDSMGQAAIIEWLNESIAEDGHYRMQEKFYKKLKQKFEG